MRWILWRRQERWARYGQGTDEATGASEAGSLAIASCTREAFSTRNDHVASTSKGREYLSGAFRKFFVRQVELKYASARARRLSGPTIRPR
jgi:hypothetical protein